MESLISLRFPRLLHRLVFLPGTTSHCFTSSRPYAAASDPNEGISKSFNGAQSPPTSNAPNPPAYMSVRPGPWKTNQAAYKNLGRVFGDYYLEAKSLNNEIVTGAAMTLQKASLAKNKVESGVLAMNFLEQIKRIVEAPDEEVQFTFVNVSTLVHRVGLVVGATGSEGLAIKYYKMVIQRYCSICVGDSLPVC